MPSGPLEWRALSIRQPWIDMILRGDKTIEVREWEIAPTFRGPFVLHAAYGVDWKTLAMLDAEPKFEAARGAYVGRASVVDVIELSAATNWRETLMGHRVVHPPTFDRTVFGLVLADVRRFPRSVRATGRPYFFPVGSDAMAQLEDQLA